MLYLFCYTEQPANVGNCCTYFKDEETEAQRVQVTRCVPQLDTGAWTGQGFLLPSFFVYLAGIQGLVSGLGGRKAGGKFVGQQVKLL